MAEIPRFFCSKASKLKSFLVLAKWLNFVHGRQIFISRHWETPLIYRTKSLIYQTCGNPQI